MSTLPPHAPAKSRAPLVVAAFVGVLLVFLALRLIGDRPSPGARSSATPPASAAATPFARAPKRVDWPAQGAAPSQPPRRGPVIDSIEVDKTEVCSGEENFANVKARGDDGATERLVVRLAGTREMGFRMPFRLERGVHTELPHVLVSGPNGPSAVGKVPDVVIKDCDVERRVAIRVNLDPQSPHVLTLNAELSEAPHARHFEPASYEWSFGDGTSATTTGPSVEHSYEGRPQTTRYSYMLMTVKVRGRRGQTVEGSRAYGFTNFGFGPLIDEQRVAIFSAGASRPGGKNGAGEVVRLYHGYEQPVHLERVVAREIFRGGDQSADQPEREYDPTELLGVDTLAPGESTRTRDLGSLRPTEPGHQLVIELFGHAGDMAASGRIVLNSTQEDEDHDAPLDLRAELHALPQLPAQE